MYVENFSRDQKKEIAKAIKKIDLDTVNSEFEELQKIGDFAYSKSERCRIGNNVVDYFTFAERLDTRGKYDINYYEFINNIDIFSQKKFIKNMMEYYKKEKNKNNTKNILVVLKEVYNICISAINIIRPLVYMEIYSKYKPKCVLDFCAGWGGAAVAASALGIERYIGIEINKDLEPGYKELTQFLNARSSTQLNMFFQDALTVDYSVLDYDLVFTSPPYYFIQKYKNNKKYEGRKEEMDKKFYIPLFQKTWSWLKSGGTFALNVNREVYMNVCIKLLGEAHDIYSYKKSKRQNNYEEVVYVWKKK